MARALTILTSYKDEVGRLATATVETGTPNTDPNYTPDILQNDNPAQVAKIDSVTGAWLFTFAAAQRIDLAALIHHDFIASGSSPDITVVLEANTSNSWGAPAFSAAFTIPAWRASGTTWQWPINPWLDLTAESDYSTTGWQYWRLSIVNNDQNLQLGGVKLYSAFQQFVADFRPSLPRATRKRSIVNTTAFEVDTIYPRGINRWEQTGSLILTSAQAELLKEHYFDVNGQAMPFVVIPNGLRNEAYFVRRPDEFGETVEFYSEGDDTELLTMTLPLREVSRGLRPGV